MAIDRDLGLAREVDQEHGKGLDRYRDLRLFTPDLLCLGCRAGEYKYAAIDLRKVLPHSSPSSTMPDYLPQQPMSASAVRGDAKPALINYVAAIFA